MIDTIHYTADGKPHSFIYKGGPFYYVLNLQGDVIGITTVTGILVAEYTYDSWGKPVSVTVNNPIYEDLALANPLRYRGYVYDNETGLYYLQSRYYDPELCRFISADAYLIAGNALQGTNMFAYCLNNPVRYSDPSGCAPDSSVEAKYDLSNPAMLISAIFICAYICLDEEEGLDMSPYRFMRFVLITRNWSDRYYLSLVMLNGKTNGGVTDVEFIEGNSFNVCQSLTSKEVCYRVSSYYNIEGMTYYEVAKEIYGHAMMYYHYDDVKSIVNPILEFFGKRTIDVRANPIDLGDNSMIYTMIFDYIWSTNEEELL